MAACGMALLKKRIEKYWNWRSTSYELDQAKSTETVKEWESTINALVSHVKGDDLRALDVGTGPGQLAFYLARAGFKTTGIDISAHMVARADQTARSDGLSCDFRTGDAEQLPFEDNAFDVVVTRNLVWTLPDPGAAIREWHRVLKPGGRIIISDGYWKNITWSRIHHLILKGVKVFLQTGSFISCRFFSCYAGLIKDLPLYEGVTVNDADKFMSTAGFKDILSWDIPRHFSKNPYGAGRLTAPVFFIIYGNK
ncbi:class I SAM-dependent methyltransferase [uncultured Desulfobacter sp.]|uniref:class I SAM-dependent methyltransferase n=1 Tax=uncultured Desulfobacter sp. TaxID=240139 RepID=UPI002AAA7D14|nr:class I SAM-dependent methyltransferase [uncultured Desulfobacter sp.]